VRLRLVPRKTKLKNSVFTVQLPIINVADPYSLNPDPDPDPAL
jgi:hypothetical protein